MSDQTYIQELGRLLAVGTPAAIREAHRLIAKKIVHDEPK